MNEEATHQLIAEPRARRSYRDGVQTHHCPNALRGHNRIGFREQRTIKRSIDLTSNDVGHHPGRRRVTKEEAS